METITNKQVLPLIVQPAVLTTAFLLITHMSMNTSYNRTTPMSNNEIEHHTPLFSMGEITPILTQNHV